MIGAALVVAAVLQAQGGVWRALAGLGVAAGQDVTGLVN